MVSGVKIDISINKVSQATGVTYASLLRNDNGSHTAEKSIRNDDFFSIFI